MAGVKYEAEYLNIGADGGAPTYCPVANECGAGYCCYENIVCVPL